jgi:glycosyltransferase involved in cell wall biosynthesis
MKRVLLTSHKFFPQHRAGTEVLTLKIAQELQARGYCVKVVAGNPPDLDARRKVEHLNETSTYVYDGIDVEVVEEALRLKESSFNYEFNNPHVQTYFGKLLDEFKPDLVQMVHSQNLSAAIIDECQKRAIPIVFYATDFWFVCPVVQLKKPDGSICRGPSPGAANCLTCYTPELLPPSKEVVEAVSTRFPAFAPLAQLTEPMLGHLYRELKKPKAVSATKARPAYLAAQANKLNKILVPTKLMRDIFVENGINPELIQLCHFGIDTSKLINHTQKQPSPLFRIGYVGTFFEHKGVDLLLEAFNNLPPELLNKAQLKLYGDPTQFPQYFQKLEAIANSEPASKDRIHFLGTFPNERFGEIMEELDVLVVPSRWYENTPLVMQSALATKTPLIVTDLGGMSELVEHEVNGMLFKLNDWQSLRQQLAQVISQPGLLQKLKENIKPERTVQDMVDDIEGVYLRVGLRQVAM